VWIPILTLKARKNVDKEEYAVAKKKKENESNRLSAASTLSTSYSTESKDSDTSPAGIDDDIESGSGHEIHHLHVY